MQPDGDLVLHVVLFLWGKVKAVVPRENLMFTHSTEKVDYYKVSSHSGKHFLNLLS